LAVLALVPTMTSLPLHVGYTMRDKRLNNYPIYGARSERGGVTSTDQNGIS